jgi:hydrogenase nickel incorporation protein HypA/HybF
MHEMSLAQNILDIVLVTARQHSVQKVLSVSIRAGELRGIVPEQIQFCFGLLTKDSIAEGAELQVNTVAIKARCKGCSKEFPVKEFRFICPACDHAELETLQGLELLVENIEVL